MKLLVNDKEVAVESSVIYEDFNYYYSFITIKTVMDLKTQKLTLKETVPVLCHVLRVDYQSPYFVYTCITESQYEILNTLTIPFEGEATVEMMLRSVGVTPMFTHNSQSTYWTLPSMKLKTLIDTINNYAVYPNGGGVRAYLDLNGCISVHDTTLELANKATDIINDVSQDTLSLDWVTVTPGKVNLTVYDGLLQTNEELVFEKDMGVGNARISVNTEYAKDLFIAKLRNNYFYNRNTARKLVIDLKNSSVYKLGTTLTISGLGPFIVTSLIQPFQTNTQPSFTIKLAGRLI